MFNIGEIENKGVELLLNVKAVTNTSFSWDIGYNMSYNKNKVMKLYGDLPRIQVDQPRAMTLFTYQQINSPFSSLIGNGYQRDAAGQIVYNA